MAHSADSPTTVQRLISFKGIWSAREQFAVRKAVLATEPTLKRMPTGRRLKALWQASASTSGEMRTLTVFRVGHSQVLCASGLAEICKQIRALGA